MIALLAAIVLPLAGATQINVQVESGGVHLIAAAGIHTVTIRRMGGGNAAPPHVEVSRPGASTISVSLTGKSAVNLPFVSGAAGSGAYEIVYPAKLRIAAEDHDGSIVASNARGDLDLEADHGDVTVTLAPGWNGPELRMQSASGNLRLTVPHVFHARVDASTGSGQLHNALGRGNAKAPFVWLYTQQGDIWISRT
jgi:hypothetical protein